MIVAASVDMGLIPSTCDKREQDAFSTVTREAPGRIESRYDTSREDVEALVELAQQKWYELGGRR